jgi:hypothetical protein
VRTAIAAGLSVSLTIGCVAEAGCKRSAHARVASFTPPALPAGFVEQGGARWRIRVPSTWKDAAQQAPATWMVADPQAADDFRANASVVTEPFPGESYDYARATEASLRHASRAAVEIARDDIVDGDPTLTLETRWAPIQPAAAPYRTMQVALASRGTGYIVTCSASSAAFERYRSTCESIVHSFAVER